MTVWLVFMCIIGYFMIGLIAARCYYRSRIKRDQYHDRYQTLQSRWYVAFRERHYRQCRFCVRAAFATVFFWPMWVAVVIVYGAMWFVTRNPPEPLTERLKQLEKENTRLEKELGL